jgi:hypothetical protein
MRRRDLRSQSIPLSVSIRRPSCDQAILGKRTPAKITWPSVPSARIAQKSSGVVAPPTGLLRRNTTHGAVLAGVDVGALVGVCEVAGGGVAEATAVVGERPGVGVAAGPIRVG